MSVPGLTVHEAMAMMSSGWSEAMVGAVHSHAVRHEYVRYDFGLHVLYLQKPGRRLVLHPTLSKAWDVIEELEGLPPGTLVEAWTDGSGVPTDASVGCGAVLRWPGSSYWSVSASLGPATNNVGELRGIQLALACVPRVDLRLSIKSDSMYSIGSLTLPWQARKNIDLIAEIKAHLRLRPASLSHVKGHAGNEGNELADRAAGAARRK